MQRYAVSTDITSGGKGIGVDTNGNVFVSGSSRNGTNYGFATLAYSNTGTPLWTNRYDAGARSGQAAALAVGRDGKVFVTGSTFDTTNPALAGIYYSFATVAYSGGGVALWTNSFSEGGDARPVAIAVGQSGMVFVTGRSSFVPVSGVSTMTILAYSSAGVPLWTNHYQSVSGQRSGAIGIALDDKENVFVAGYADEAGENSHYVVLAYSAAGVPLWTNRYIGAVSSFDAASAVAVGGNGNVFVTGEAYNTNGFPDYLTVACSGDGVALWTNRYSSENASYGNAIAVDANSNIFVTGRSWSGAGTYDYATVAYDAAGSALWTNRYDGPAHSTDDAIAVAADGRGHVVVTGSSPDSGNSTRLVTIWYSTSGTPLFTNRYNGPVTSSDQPGVLAVDAAGSVFVTGNSSGAIATVKFALVQPVPLLVQRLADQVVLSWTNAAFGLQSAPTLSDVFTNVPGATSPYTNGISGGGQFFRLSPM